MLAAKQGCIVFEPNPHDIQELEIVTTASLNVYLQAGLPEFASRIHVSVTNGELHRVFVPRSEGTPDGIIMYSVDKKTVIYFL
jgi:hypothetical protein